MDTIKTFKSDVWNKKRTSVLNSVQRADDSLRLNGVNGWDFAGSLETPDTINSGMQLESGPNPEDSVQRFNSCGWTVKRGLGDWVSQNSFVKKKLKQTQYPWPDIILVDLKILKISIPKYLGLGSCVAMLDTTGEGLAGYAYGPIQNISGWQTIKRVWGGPRGNAVTSVAFAFACYATDSGHVGIEVQVNNLRFVYNNGDTILIDPFQIEWPKPVGISDEKQTPSEFVLSQNYPNPFNPSTKIKFTVPKTDQVDLIVYNSLGQEVETLVSEEKSAGDYEVEFKASSLPSGIYFCRIRAGDFVESKKMILMK